MMLNFLNLTSTKLFVLLGFILFFSVLTTLPLPWNEPAEDILIDLQFKIRGHRQLSDDIVLVFIGAEDVKAFGGWSITRDYYGYMTYNLSRSGAKVMGIDVLFDRPDRYYKDYDAILADFFQSAGNVCLPVTFSELTSGSNKTTSLQTGYDPTFPFEELKAQAAGLGFSNFGKETIVRKVPLAVTHGDSFMLSFGCELARLYLGCTTAVQVNPHTMVMADSLGHSYSFPIDQQGRLRLNHFGDIEDVSAIGFVDLLQAFETAPDSLDFDDKLILVAATAPGLAALKATPLTSVLPGVLIHATVAENLIHQNYLQQVSVPIQWILILLLVISAWLVSQANRREAMVIGSVGLLFLYWFIAMLTFSAANLILPLFYPTVAYLATLAYLFIERARQSHLQQASIKTLLKEQVITKETRLEEAKVKLAELESQLHYETTVSEQTKRLADERKQTILKLEKELRDLQTYIVPERQSSPVPFPEIVYAKNSKMAQVLELVAKVSPDDISVLILGETGTGKEMIARAIHQTSQRREAPFVPINCGALPETLLESELFGHEKGSFTGARSRRRGRFELANGGTIFLDEITETTPAFQARLLRVLQEGTFERLGGEQTIRVNVRVIAASNKDLQEQMEKGHFRSDLFYRLNGFLITLPPLRERLEDIPLLAVHFLRKYGHHSVGFSERAMQVLRTYPWPGNVRELENVVRRAAILAKSEGRNVIRESDLPEEILKSDFAFTTYKPLEEQVLDSLRALKFSRSAISQTAQALGNRDRGTITEYFRGICFEHLVKADYDVDTASKAIAATTEEQVIAKVRAKINEYLSNLQAWSPTSKEKEAGVEELSSSYKGLPKKYHPYLQQILEHLMKG